MSATDHHDAIVRPLLAPGRLARVLVVGGLSLFFGCGLHAVYAAHRANHGTADSLVRRLHLSDLALVPDDDLRHPGWGRSEQGRAGQPDLPDPRGASTLVRPLPMKVSK